MSAGVALDVAIAVLFGVAVLGGLVALRVHALDHPQQRGVARPRPMFGSAVVPLVVSAFYQGREIVRAPLGVRGAATAFLVADVVLLILGGLQADRDLRRRSADPLRAARRTPGPVSRVILTAGVVAGGIEAALLGTLAWAIGVPVAIVLAVVVVFVLARAWRRIRPAPHPHPHP